MSRDPDALLEQTQWDFFWVPDDATVVDRPELLYVCCPRDVATLNCATRTRGDASRLPSLIEEVSGAQRAVRSRWMVRATEQAHLLEVALDRSGYCPSTETHAYAISVDAYHRRRSSGFLVTRVATMTELRHCAQVIDQAFSGRSFTEAELETDLANCTGPGARVQRFVAYDQRGDPISSGGMTLHPALGLGFLWAGATVPSARGRGAYSAVVAARIEAARELGFSHVGLYAMVHSSAPIVARQGFVRCGTMTYWERPSLVRSDQAV